MCVACYFKRYNLQEDDITVSERCIGLFGFFFFKGGKAPQ